MLKQGHIVDETMFPSPKRWWDVIKNLIIPDQPDVPTCHNNHFHKERLIEKLSSSSKHLLDVIPLGPFNLEIGPNSSAKIILKEEMYSVLMNPPRTELTVILICNIPVPSFE